MRKKSTNVPRGAASVTATRSAGGMTIGAAARSTGVSEKMIRHYEQLGLLAPATRSSSGYRLYTGKDLDRLAFIALARSASIGLDEIRQMLKTPPAKLAPLLQVLDDRASRINDVRNALIAGVA